MKFPLVCLGAAAALTLAACGDRATDMSVADIPDLPLQTPLHALQTTIHVGADVAPPADALQQAALHGETRVSYGSVQDGIGAAEVIAYLQADAASFLNEQDQDDDPASMVEFPGGLLLRFGPVPPTVRVVDGTPPALIDETIRVVQAINAALPIDWQLEVSRDPAPAGTVTPSEGEILVVFAREEDWPQEAAPPIDENIGLAEPLFTIAPTGDPNAPFRIEIGGGRVFVDHTRTEGLERLGVIAHELIHLLGRSHVDPIRFPRTIMVGGGSEELSPHILHPLDREALLAVYGELEPGTTPNDIAEELGDWSDTSLHIRGAVDIEDGEIAFGVALRNGLSQPWTSGPSPHTDVEDNPALSDDVSWSGRLIGLTPDAEAVAGEADLSVDLATLTGMADFTGLEQWAANAAPGALGTGATWDDGNLRYDIEIRGNTFVQTVGDAGTVTGAFFGPAHEGMGGVLEHDKLSAGFGGKR